MTIRYIFLFFLIFGCKNQTPNRVPITVNSKTYALFGEQFTTDNVITTEQFTNKTQNLKDTLQVVLKGTIKDLCSKKGCWMTMTLSNGDDMMIRFKDYGFFMPLDAKGEIIVHGKAFRTETSVSDLKHYAEDAGASEQEIEAITQPKQSLSFEASGVLLAQ